VIGSRAYNTNPACDSGNTWRKDKDENDILFDEGLVSSDEDGDEDVEKKVSV